MLQMTPVDIEKADSMPVETRGASISNTGVAKIPIANPESISFGKIRFSLIWLGVSIISYGLYGIFLSHMLGAPYLIFLPAIQVCLPLVIFVPIFGSLFSTEMGTFLFVTNIMMTWVDFPIMLINSAIAGISSYWVVAYLNAGLLEEILKALVYMIPLWMGRIRYGFQVIHYAAIAGLMFGVGENVLYAVQFKMLTGQKISESEVMGSSISDILIQYRMFTTVVLHILLTVLGACFVAYTLTGLWSLSKRWLACTLAILVSAILHGTYDAFLMNLDGQYSFVSTIIFGVLVVSVLALLLYMRARQIAQVSQ